MQKDLTLSTQNTPPIQDRSINELIIDFLNSQDVKQTSRDLYGRTIKQFVVWLESKTFLLCS